MPDQTQSVMQSALPSLTAAHTMRWFAFSMKRAPWLKRTRRPRPNLRARADGFLSRKWRKNARSHPNDVRSSQLRWKPDGPQKERRLRRLPNRILRGRRLRPKRPLSSKLCVGTRRMEVFRIGAGHNLKRCITPQWFVTGSEASRESICLGLAPNNRLRNIAKTCAKTR